MRKDNVESLLDSELVAAMRKRPGLYIGGFGYERIQCLYNFIFKTVLHNSSDSLRMEWLIEDDLNCSLSVYEGNLTALKEKLITFTNIENLSAGDTYVTYIYYAFYLFFTRIEISLCQNGERMVLTKETDSIIWDLEDGEGEKRCVINFSLDPKVFDGRVFHYQSLMEYVRIYAYQYPMLAVMIQDNRELKQLNTFHYPNGLKDKLDDFHDLKNGGGPRMCEVEHECTVEGCRIKLYFYIADHVYIHPPRDAVYAEDYLDLCCDKIIKPAVIRAMKQSMVEFSHKNKLDLNFKESQLMYLTDFVASIHGGNLRYGTWRQNLEMPELGEALTLHMKQYFDELFLSDDKYIEMMTKLGFKTGNTLFLDAVFPAED